MLRPESLHVTPALAVAEVSLPGLRQLPDAEYMHSQVVMEYEGVLVEETQTFHHQAWRQLAEEEGKPAPLQFALKRAAGMKAEQVRPGC